MFTFFSMKSEKNVLLFQLSINKIKREIYFYADMLSPAFFFNEIHICTVCSMIYDAFCNFRMHQTNHKWYSECFDWNKGCKVFLMKTIFVIWSWFGCDPKCDCDCWELWWCFRFILERTFELFSTFTIVQILKKKNNSWKHKIEWWKIAYITHWKTPHNVIVSFWHSYDTWYFPCVLCNIRHVCAINIT